MGGGLIQLVAQGAETMYLTGNPKMSYFKCVYRKYTNFATEYIEENFNNTVDFGKTAYCKLPRNADLIHKIYIKVKLPALKQTDSGGDGSWVGYVNGIGNVLLKDISIEIGGQVIDRHFSNWNDIWGSLTMDDYSYNNMVGNYESDYSLRTNALEAKTYYIPLNFWFNKHICSSIPLLAIQYHEVIMNIEFRSAAECITSDISISSPLDSASNTLAISDASVLIEYIYIDTIERQRFANNSHEYLIDQLQTQTETIAANTTYKNIALNLFHPVKELFWVIQKTANITPASSNNGNHMILYSDPSNNKETFLSSRLMLNGKPRYTYKDAKFFRLVQPMKTHSYIPDQFIYTYSFSINPEKYQPSGSCNFGKINISELELKFNSSTSAFFDVERTIKIYATSYNIFKVQSGLGGVVFSN